MIIILFLCYWTPMYFSSTECCCVSHFAASVQGFLFASVRAFPSSPQRLGCHNNQNAHLLNYNTCCFELFEKPHSANSYFYLIATSSLVLIIVSWRWVLVSSCHLCSKFWGFSVCICLSKTFWFCSICRGWVCTFFVIAVLRLFTFSDHVQAFQRFTPVSIAWRW